LFWSNYRTQTISEWWETFSVIHYRKSKSAHLFQLSLKITMMEPLISPWSNGKSLHTFDPKGTEAADSFVGHHDAI
tara:strand:+ start:4914 stop:5141 length:228 start_codon:yes stop_codon:yes gene_type:complete